MTTPEGLVGLCCLMCLISICCYLFTFVFGLHNLVVFIVGQHLYKKPGGFLVTLFYGIALLNLILRFVQYMVETISKAGDPRQIFVLSQVTGLLRVDLGYIVML